MVKCSFSLGKRVNVFHCFTIHFWMARPKEGIFLINMTVHLRILSPATANELELASTCWSASPLNELSSKARNKFKMTKFPMTKTVINIGMHTSAFDTRIHSNILSIHSPHWIRKTIKKAWGKSIKCQRGKFILVVSFTSAPLSTGFPMQVQNCFIKFLVKNQLIKNRKN